MNNSVNDEIIREILRPKIIFLQGSGRTFLNFMLAIEAGCIILGLILNPVIAIIALGILFAFPGIPLLVGLFWHCMLSIIVYDKKLVIKDYSFNSFLEIETRQEIFFRDIDYIYYLGKEYNLLKNYRHKLRKYKISKKEMDYRKENLIQKYAVPNEAIETFEHISQKSLNDYVATGVLMAVSAIADKYNIPKHNKKSIIKDLKKTSDFDFEYIKSLLAPYGISSEDIDNLKDEFSDCDVNTLSPFLLTKLKVATAERNENWKDTVTVPINTTLVFSNEDGTEKVYIKHFHLIGRANWQKLIQVINENQPGIRYLMSGQSYRNLTDLNFKPGCG